MTDEYIGNTEDAVNNPGHYNKQGIEVIDVIEAYELPYHLGNVIKYVCRAAYKGKQEQDLRKALWYLDRHIEETFDHPRGYNLSEAQAFFDGYDLATDEALLAHDNEVQACGAAILGDPLEEMETGKPVVTFAPDLYPIEPTIDSVITFGDFPTEPMYFTTDESRIAGDDDAACRIKNDVYGYDPSERVGTCRWCYKPLLREDGHVTIDAFGLDTLFCSFEHADRELRATTNR